MGAVFVCGTDTGVGKTYFCAQLQRYLLAKQVHAGYQKWISTGDADASADLAAVLQAAGITQDPGLLDLQVPFRFAMPASPHLAGEQEGRVVGPEILLSSFSEMQDRYEFLVVEGVGGLHVPLTRDLLLADFLARLRIPTLIVARSGLGTLNHTFLTLEALRSREVPVIGVVFSDAVATEDEVIVADNMKTIAEMGKVTVFGRMPWIAPGNAGGAVSFMPIGDAVYRAVQAGG